MSCAIRVLLQDMKQLKQHLLELEAQRKILEQRDEQIRLLKQELDDEEDEDERDGERDDEREEDSRSDSIRTEDEVSKTRGIMLD